MPSSAIEAANSAVNEIFIDGTINEDSPTPGLAMIVNR